ncbi:MAG: type II toxin-antitoxin system RelE/ParE family toxin [Alphaproteobacteria bacterium]
MIKSFKGAAAQAIWERRVPRGMSPDFARIVLRKLRYLDAASVLSDLSAPPGNRLETLRKDRMGQHSIRVNDQYRLCFIWRAGDVDDVELVDYH